MYQHRLPLPADIAADLQARGARRVLGTMNGEAFDLALHTSKDEGFICLGISRGRMRTMKLTPGDLVEVELSMDLDPDHVDPGPELSAAFASNGSAREAWDGLTPGRKRHVAWTVTSAKREATRQSRAQETARKLADGTHPVIRQRS